MKRAISHQEHLERLDYAVTLENITVTCDGFITLQNINLNIPAGEITGIIGPNGAGKTTLLKAILGIIKPDAGNIYIFARANKGLKNDLGFIPSHRNVDWSFPTNLLGLVLMGSYDRLKNTEAPSQTDKEEALDAIERLKLHDIYKKNISELTFSERQRTLIARALVQNPRIYIADEPLMDCDTRSTEIILNIFSELKNLKKTILTAHHHILSVPLYFDNTAFLNITLNAWGKTQEIFIETNIKKTFGIRENLLTKFFPTGKI